MGDASWRARYGEWAVIAGGSEGIGRAFAERLAARGLNLILLARNVASLEEAATACRAYPGVTVVTQALDLTGDDLGQHLAELAEGREIGLVIYNAGAVHGTSLLLDEPFEKAVGLVKLNCLGPLAFVRQFAPGMVARGRGGIVLVSSLSGLSGAGYIAGYAAAKAYENALAEGLWIELGQSGVNVLGLICGATDTPAMARSGTGWAAKGSSSGFVPMNPFDVADEGLSHLADGPIWVAGAANRQAAEGLRSSDRVSIVQGMTAATAGLYGLPPLGLPGASEGVADAD